MRFVALLVRCSRSRSRFCGEPNQSSACERVCRPLLRDVRAAGSDGMPPDDPRVGCGGQDITILELHLARDASRRSLGRNCQETGPA